MMIAKTIAKNFLFLTLGRVASFFLALLIVGYTSRYLGVAWFGNYSTILAFIYIFTVLSDLGLYQISTREISKSGADEAKIISHAFSMRFFVGAAIFACAPLIALMLPYPAVIKNGILIAVIGFWLLSNAQVLVGVFQKHLKAWFVSLGDVAGRVLQLILVIAFVYLNRGFYSIVLAMVLGATLNFLIIFIKAKQLVNFKNNIDFFGWRNLFKESMPLAIAGVLTMVYFKMDTVLLSLMKPASDVGIYALAYRVLESLIFFPVMFVGLIMPQIVRLSSLEQAEAAKKMAQKTLDIILIGAVPLMVGGWFLSDKIVLLLGGNDFIKAAAPLNILLAATAIIFLGAFFSTIMIIANQQKTLSLIYGIGAAVNVVANLIFIPIFSYIGASFTTLATEILVTLLMIWAIYVKQRHFYSFKIMFKIIIATLIMALFLWLMPDFKGAAAIELMGGGLIYLGALYLVGGFTRKDINLFLNNE